MTTQLLNPLIPGFNPDPSVVRVGDVYYVVTSTFEYLPGIPIYRSTDFRTWEQVGNVVTREEQVGIGHVPSGGGVYAPTIRHRDGTFYVIVSVPGGRGCVLFTATDPTQEWSDGILIPLAGIDPDLAWDHDGTTYLTYSGAALDFDSGSSHGAIQQVRVDLATGEVVDEPRSLWAGTGLKFPEAPHLYQRGDHWYLLIAEGGTERGHSVSIARGTSPAGPFEPGPANPILSARSTDRPIQNTGHGDLVELPDGTTGMVLLGMRPGGLVRAFSPLGRETFATRVAWVDDWPVAEPVALNPCPAPTDYDADFAAESLDAGWMGVRRTPAEVASLTDGSLVIEGDGTLLTEQRPCLVGRRQVTSTASVSAHVDSAHGTGGMALLFDQVHHYAIEASATADGTQVVARAHVAGIQQVWEAVLAPGPVILSMSMTPVTGGLESGTAPDRVRLSAAPAADPASEVVLADLDGRYLSAEVAAPFTGRVVGLYALTGTVGFNTFAYRGSEQG